MRWCQEGMSVITKHRFIDELCREKCEQLCLNSRVLRRHTQTSPALRRTPAAIAAEVSPLATLATLPGDRSRG